MGFEFGGPGKKTTVKSFMTRPTEPDPIADVEYTGNVEQDSAAELDAVASAFRARRDQERDRFQQATDSEYWMALCFRSREHKEAFIRAVGAAALGDKYVDGHAFAKALGIELPE